MCIQQDDDDGDKKLGILRIATSIISKKMPIKDNRISKNKNQSDFILEKEINCK